MILLADYDIPTRSASGFLIRHISLRSSPNQLYGPLDRRALFSKLSRFGDVIIGVGHGEEDRFYGQGDEEVLLRVGGYSPDEVKGKFIKLISCETASLLGPDLIEKGAIAFQGYDEDYLWVADQDFSLRPWDDPLASEFMVPMVESVSAILDGKVNRVVYQIEVNGYSKSLKGEENELVASCLIWDMDHLIYLGEPGVSIKPRRGIKLPFDPPPLPPLLAFPWSR